MSGTPTASPAGTDPAVAPGVTSLAAPASPPVQAPSPPPTVDQMVSEIIQAFKGEGEERSLLEDQRASLTTVVTAYLTYVGGPGIEVLLMGRNDALRDLEVNLGLTAKDLQDACSQVIDATATATMTLADRFNALTGSDLQGAQVFDGFGRRYQDELKEQEAGRQLAEEVLAMIMTICGTLGISNPDPGAQPASVVSSVANKDIKSRFTLGMHTVFRAAAMVVMEERPAKPAVPAPKPSWQTPPVIKPEDRDVLRVRSAHSRVTAVKDLAKVWPMLQNLKLGRDQLLDLMARVSQKARDQLVQRQQVLDDVAGSYTWYARAIETVNQVQTVVNAVDDFFFPEAQSAARPTKSGH